MTTYKTIADLSPATSVTGTDQLEVNQGGATRSLTVAQLGANYLPLTGGTLAGPGDLTMAGSFMPSADGTQAQGSVTARWGLVWTTAPVVVTPPGTAKLLRLQSVAAGVATNRWTLGSSATAESGGNVGSDFSISAYSDTGVSLGNPLAITRSTGAVTLTGALTGTTATMSTSVTTPLVTATANFTSNVPTGQQFLWQFNSVNTVGMLVNTFYPTTTNAVNLGASANRWAGVYSVLGDFSGIVTALTGTAVGAGANTQAFVKASSTANLGIYYGNTVPTFSAAKGSLYSNTAATTTTTRLYVNTDGGTTWTNLTTAA